MEGIEAAFSVPCCKFSKDCKHDLKSHYNPDGTLTIVHPCSREDLLAFRHYATVPPPGDWDFELKQAFGPPNLVRDNAARFDMIKPVADLYKISNRDPHASEATHSARYYKFVEAMTLLIYASEHGFAKEMLEHGQVKMNAFAFEGYWNSVARVLRPELHHPETQEPELYLRMEGMPASTHKLLRSLTTQAKAGARPSDREVTAARMEALKKHSEACALLYAAGLKNASDTLMQQGFPLFGYENCVKNVAIIMKAFCPTEEDRECLERMNAMEL